MKDDSAPLPGLAASLSADRPSTDPAKDLFGHAPFARTLAKAIHGYQASDGIVLALYGPWGSGKSTVLAYVEHELGKLPERERPVVVSFNPWWFSGQDNLAKAFLGQLQAVLPAKYKGFENVGSTLAEFSNALGGLAEVAGKAHGIPFLGKFVEAGAKRLAPKPRDVPALKLSLSRMLLEKKKRVLVMVDDIDRLAPDEVRQLFTVIKAVADFPYVSYLLAFDREVAAKAISEHTGLPGDRYIEKIVQVPFELPAVDKATLRKALFARLEVVVVLPQGDRFDSVDWGNVFHSGLDPLLSVPRDIVRLTNALSVTYPAVAGEVNPVDFIAVECIRVFLPEVYCTIRTYPDEFVGYGAPGDQQAEQRAVTFHDEWLKKVPYALRASTQELLRRLFPKLDSVWSNMMHSADSLQRWRRELRVCAPDIFSVYFRLSLQDGSVSRLEVNQLIGCARSPADFAAVLRSAADQKNAAGVSKVRFLLERLMDHVPDELEVDVAEPVIEALLCVGDELLLKTDRVPGEFDFGNESRVTRVAYHMLKKVTAVERRQLLVRAIGTGNALRCGQYLLAALAEETEKAAKGDGEALLAEADIEAIKAAWLQRVALLSQSDDFIDRPGLGRILNAWRRWGGDDAQSWWGRASRSDDGVCKLVAAFSYEVTTHGIGDHSVAVRLRVNPKDIARFEDVDSLYPRAVDLLSAGSVDARFLPAVKQFVHEFERMKAGEDPNALDFDDDRI